MNTVAAIACLIVIITMIARADDHPNKPAKTGLVALVKLQLEKVAILMVAVSCGWLFISIASGAIAPAEVVVLVSGLALRMVAHPDGWFEYVTTSKAEHTTRRSL